MINLKNTLSKTSSLPFKHSDFLMGTPVHQTLYGINAKLAALVATSEIKRLEKLWSIFSPESEICNLNKLSGKSACTVNTDTISILKLANQISKMSKGTFDISIAPLVQLWTKAAASNKPPVNSQIEELLPLVNFSQLKLTNNNKAFLEKKGQEIDLGAIGKGFAADRAREIYLHYGIRSAFINLGGNVLVHGSKPDGSPWNIGIQKPKGQPGEYIGYIQTVDSSIVTSGYYERSFEYRGKLYHHLLDPRTGWPTENNIASVTVVCQSSAIADALATATYVMGISEGLSLIRNTDGAEAVFIDNNNKIFPTNGCKFHSIN